ncbi:MAG: hypothetical protein ACREDQ_03015 [Limisphaerales bacterium]
MMNEETEQFERCLSRQPLRPVPAEWREEILAAADSYHRSPVERRSFLSTLNSQLSIILWPHPVAWAGLAAVWIFIFTVDFSVNDRAPSVAEGYSPPPTEVIVEVRQQRQLLAELMGPRETRDAERSKSLTPRPRSELNIEILMT